MGTRSRFPCTGGVGCVVLARVAYSHELFRFLKQCQSSHRSCLSVVFFFFFSCNNAGDQVEKIRRSVALFCLEIALSRKGKRERERKKMGFNVAEVSNVRCGERHRGGRMQFVLKASGCVYVTLALLYVQGRRNKNRLTQRTGSCERHNVQMLRVWERKQKGHESKKQTSRVCVYFFFSFMFPVWFRAWFACTQCDTVSSTRDNYFFSFFLFSPKL